MIAPDYRIPRCGAPLAHDQHVFMVMAHGIAWMVQCSGQGPYDATEEISAPI